MIEKELWEMLALFIGASLFIVFGFELAHNYFEPRRHKRYQVIMFLIGVIILIMFASRNLL